MGTTEEQALKDRIKAIMAENKLRNDLNKPLLANPTPEVAESLMKDTIPAINTLKAVLSKIVIEVERPRRRDNETEKQYILRTHGGQLSNIPINSPYWGLRK